MNKSLPKLYFLIPIVLFLVQVLFTLRSTNQLLFEDFQYKEVLYLRHHLVWDPLGAGDLGYYGTMNIYNNLFGFQLFGFKYFRLGLDLVSLICLALLLKKLFGVKKAIIPLLTLGLSPTLLYFNVRQVPYGIDFQYFPICLLLLTAKPKKSWLTMLPTASGWFLAMLAWLTYASFLFYLPVLAYFSLKTVVKSPKKQLIPILGVSLICFILPLALHLVNIQNKNELVDPVSGQGLFRGSGTFEPSIEGFSGSLVGLGKNLFYKASAYHFEVAQVDFSWILPAILVLGVFLMPLKFLKRFKEIRMPVLLCFGLGILNITLVSLSVGGADGFRRETPFLASIYGLFIISYYIYLKTERSINLPKTVVSVFLGLFLIHHLIVLPLNLSHIQDISPFKDNFWFSIKGDPESSVNQLTQELSQKDLYLNCQEKFHQQCSYTDIFAVLESECEWNHLNCHYIYGYTEEKAGYQKLSREFLKDYDHREHI